MSTHKGKELIIDLGSRVVFYIQEMLNTPVLVSCPLFVNIYFLNFSLLTFLLGFSLPLLYTLILIGSFFFPLKNLMVSASTVSESSLLLRDRLKIAQYPVVQMMPKKQVIMSLTQIHSKQLFYI